MIDRETAIHAADETEAIAEKQLRGEPVSEAEMAVASADNALLNQVEAENPELFDEIDERESAKFGEAVQDVLSGDDDSDF